MRFTDIDINFAIGPIAHVTHCPIWDRGDGAHGQWGNSIKGVWGTGGIGHMGNGGTGGMGYGAIGTGGMGHMGNGNTWGSRVQGMAYSGYQPHGQ